jgi:hypothetical protein
VVDNHSIPPWNVVQKNPFFCLKDAKMRKCCLQGYIYTFLPESTVETLLLSYSRNTSVLIIGVDTIGTLAVF